VPTLKGTTVMKVPPGTQPDKVLRLKGLGIPSLKHHTTGDQVFTIKVHIPTKLTAKQRDMLMTVIDSYASAMAPDIASERLDRIKKAGVEKVTFAWAGAAARGERHYYRVQGPTFLIEFDNSQNDGNHVHSIWRDFNGDFGRDLLREHLKTSTN